MDYSEVGIPRNEKNTLQNTIVTDGKGQIVGLGTGKQTTNERNEPGIR